MIHQVKNHVFSNYSIERSEVEQNIKNHFPSGIDFCYTDPPWGNMKYWQTLNKKMTGVDMPQINQLEMEARIAQLIASHVKHYAFIVYGIKEAESMMAALRKHSNVKDIQYISKKYLSGSKMLNNCVIAVTLNDAPITGWKAILENKDGIDGLHAVCQLFKDKYKSCLDLFVGIGNYTVVLDKYGFQVIGNELNAARLNKAMARIDD